MVVESVFMHIKGLSSVCVCVCVGILIPRSCVPDLKVTLTKQAARVAGAAKN